MGAMIASNILKTRAEGKGKINAKKVRKAATVGKWCRVRGIAVETRRTNEALHSRTIYPEGLYS